MVSSLTISDKLTFSKAKQWLSHITILKTFTVDSSLDLCKSSLPIVHSKTQEKVTLLQVERQASIDTMFSQRLKVFTGKGRKKSRVTSRFIWFILPLYNPQETWDVYNDEALTHFSNLTAKINAQLSTILEQWPKFLYITIKEI